MYGQVNQLPTMYLLYSGCPGPGRGGSESDGEVCSLTEPPGLTGACLFGFWLEDDFSWLLGTLGLGGAVPLDFPGPVEGLKENKASC